MLRHNIFIAFLIIYSYLGICIVNMSLHGPTAVH